MCVYIVFYYCVITNFCVLVLSFIIAVTISSLVFLQRARVRWSVVGVFAFPFFAEIRGFDEHFRRIELWLFREPHADVTVES